MTISFNVNLENCQFEYFDPVYCKPESYNRQKKELEHTDFG